VSDGLIPRILQLITLDEIPKFYLSVRSTNIFHPSTFKAYDVAKLNAYSPTSTNGSRDDR